MAASKRPAPRWLEPLWEKKREETVQRVDRAIKHLLKRKQPVTLEAIRDSVKAIFQVSISINTIQRNEDAYELYRSSRAAKQTGRIKSVDLARLIHDTPTVQRPAIRARINRLRRESKDMLIARLLEIGWERDRQAARENALREELLRLAEQSRPKGGRK